MSEETKEETAKAEKKPRKPWIPKHKRPGYVASEGGKKAKAAPKAKPAKAKAVKLDPASTKVLEWANKELLFLEEIKKGGEEGKEAVTHAISVLGQIIDYAKGQNLFASIPSTKKAYVAKVNADIDRLKKIQSAFGK